MCSICLQTALQPACRIIHANDDANNRYRLHYLGAYQIPILQTAIHALKYNGIQSIGQTLGSALSVFVDNSRYEYIVPVPLHSRRYRERGFNQSLILAQSTKGNVLPVLQRQRYTTPQATLQRADRLINLQDAFTVTKQHSKKIANSRILLIDDVYTTGSTTQQCRNTLLSAGATEVDVAVVAVD